MLLFGTITTNRLQHRRCLIVAVLRGQHRTTTNLSSQDFNAWVFLVTKVDGTIQNLLYLRVPLKCQLAVLSGTRYADTLAHLLRERYPNACAHSAANMSYC
jgi:hypothetical protein